MVAGLCLKCWQQQQQQVLQHQHASLSPVLPPVIITVLPDAAMTVAVRLLGSLARPAAGREVDCSMAQICRAALVDQVNKVIIVCRRLLVPRK